MPRLQPEPAVHPFDQLHGTDTSGLIPGHIIAEGTDARVSELTAYYGVAPYPPWFVRHLAPAHEPSTHRSHRLPRRRRRQRPRHAARLPVPLPPRRRRRAQRRPRAYRQRQHLPVAQRHTSQRPLPSASTTPTPPPIPSPPSPPSPSSSTPLNPHPAPLPSSRRAVYLHNPRPFDLLYVNAEHDSYLDRHPAFTRLWTGLVLCPPPTTPPTWPPSPSKKNTDPRATNSAPCPSSNTRNS